MLSAEQCPHSTTTLKQCSVVRLHYLPTSSPTCRVGALGNRVLTTLTRHSPFNTTRSVSSDPRHTVGLSCTYSVLTSPLITTLFIARNGALTTPSTYKRSQSSTRTGQSSETSAITTSESSLFFQLLHPHVWRSLALLGPGHPHHT